MIAEALREAAVRLSATSDTARLDAELLMAHACEVTRSDLLIRRMDARAPSGFAGLVERRMTHEPIAYIIGKTEFFGLELTVTRDVLIPRGDSETLISAALAAFEGRDPPRTILDLGTGSGALLLAAMSVWRCADGIGVDRSERALDVARGNAERVLGEPGGSDCRGADRSPDGARTAGAATFIQRDWSAPGWADGLEPGDLVLCNPPYVEDTASLEPGVRLFEPHEALFAGPDGLDDYAVLFGQLRELLKPQGRAVFEIGASQAGAVFELARAAGFAAELFRDLANRPRAVVLS